MGKNYNRMDTLQKKKKGLEKAKNEIEGWISKKDWEIVT